MVARRVPWPALQIEFNVGENKFLGSYRGLLIIRKFEEAIASLAQHGEVPGFVHVSIGQEAVAVGVCGVLRNDDFILTGHRGHGHCLAKGADPYRLMAEILGKEDGLCGGKGGSMHVVDVEHANLGASGVVGGNIPLALGAAWASQIQGKDSAAVIFFGDGASGTGTFHESLNLASLWELPVLLVCENNGYAEFSSREEHSKVEFVSRFAEPYGMAASTVDGNDVVAVRAAAASALDQIRRGDGPYLLECMTYRLAGHYVGDPESYRDAQKLAEWQDKDPIRRLRERLSRNGVTDKELSGLEEEVSEQIEAVTRRARRASQPGSGAAAESVYA